MADPTCKDWFSELRAVAVLEERVVSVLPTVVLLHRALSERGYYLHLFNENVLIGGILNVIVSILAR